MNPLTPDQLVEMRSHGVDAAFVAQMREPRRQEVPDES